jgi:hypothetical protein
MVHIYQHALGIPAATAACMHLGIAGQSSPDIFEVDIDTVLTVDPVLC